MITALSRQISNITLNSAMVDEDCIELIHKYCDFKQEVRNGKLGKTGQFWMSYIDCVWLLLKFQYAVKENNFVQFVTCLRQMCNLLFSSDRLNYAHYLPYYYVQLRMLILSHPVAEELLNDGGLSVARSSVPACRIPMDMTIEQTINRSAKTSGGVIGFSRSRSSYERWCMTRHVGAAYVEATIEVADLHENANESHKAVRPPSMKRSEKDVQKLITSIRQFTNPFTVRRCKLRAACIDLN
jgi:hypothetical protein